MGSPDNTAFMSKVQNDEGKDLFVVSNTIKRWENLPNAGIGNGLSEPK